VFAALSEAGAVLVEIPLQELCAQAREMPLRLGSSMDEFSAWLGEHLPDVTLDDVRRLQRRVPSQEGAQQQSVTGEALPRASSERVVRDTLRRYNDIFQSNGLVALAFPSQLMTAPRVNAHEDRLDQEVEVAGQWVNELSMLLSTTLWGAMLGAPSLSMPIGLSMGLPVGLMLQGMPGDDARILGLAASVEQIWPSLPPPVLGTSQFGLATTTLHSRMSWQSSPNVE